MKLYSTKGNLHPKLPFDFDKTLAFMRAFGPIQAEQYVGEDFFTKAISVEGRATAFQVHSEGSLDNPKLEYETLSTKPLGDSHREYITHRMASFLGVEDDLEPFYDIAMHDPNFAPLVEYLYGYHQVRFLTPFESACWAIMSQRNPMNMALNLKRKLVREYGSCIEIDDEELWAFPEPWQVAMAEPGYIRTFIRNGRRAEFLVYAAQAFVAADEKFLATADYDEAERWLRKITGIGEWSASFILLRSLGRLENIPKGEKKLLEPFSQVYGGGHELSFEDMNRIAAIYGRYKGYWAHYLRAAPQIGEFLDA